MRPLSNSVALRLSSAMTLGRCWSAGIGVAGLLWLSSPAQASHCPADLNGDGVVDIEDVIIIIGLGGAETWARSSPTRCHPADLIPNGVVDQQDLDYLVLQLQLGDCPDPNPIPINGCMDLTQAGKTYLVQEDPLPIIIPGIRETCFSILADNITLDGNGRAIVSPGGKIGVEAAIVGPGGLNGLEIRNLTIAGFGIGINFEATADSLIEDNSFVNMPQGIRLGPDAGGVASDGNRIRNNFMTALSVAVNVEWGNYNVVECNTINNSGTGPAGAILLQPNSLNNTVAANTLGFFSPGPSPMMVGIKLIPPVVLPPPGQSLPGADYTLVIGNEVTGATFDAIAIGSSFNCIEDNRVDNTATNGDTITIRSGTNNLLIDNDIEGGNDGYRITDLRNTMITGGSVVNTNIAIHILVEGGSAVSSGITIDDVTITGSGIDLSVESLLDDFHLTDMDIGSYFIGAGLVTDFTVEDSIHGSIGFEELVNQESGDFSSDVVISDNSVFVASGFSPAINELHNLTFVDPVIILRDGFECIAPDCTLLSYEDGTAVFRVESWSVEYKIAQGP